MGRFEKAVSIITVLMAFMTLYFQLTQARNTESLIIFGILMGAVIIFFSLEYFASLVKERTEQLENLSERVKKLEEKLEYKDIVSEMDKRISILESKKGKVDPRMVAFAVIVILFLLYLRSIGVF